MNTGSVDNTVTLRHDMRNAAGGLMVAPISITSPEGGGRSDLVAVPNPVIHSCQILDDARDVPSSASSTRSILLPVVAQLSSCSVEFLICSP
jgi:hypothetical protein